VTEFLVVGCTYIARVHEQSQQYTLGARPSESQSVEEAIFWIIRNCGHTPRLFRNTTHWYVFIVVRTNGEHRTDLVYGERHWIRRLNGEYREGFDCLKILNHRKSPHYSFVSDSFAVRVWSRAQPILDNNYQKFLTHSCGFWGYTLII
jgi:hypothetical protein